MCTVCSTAMVTLCKRSTVFATAHPPPPRLTLTRMSCYVCIYMCIYDVHSLFHGHGHTVQEIYSLRYGSFPRLPDFVVWPGSHQQVEKLVALAAVRVMHMHMYLQMYVL